MLLLNERSWKKCDELVSEAPRLNISVSWTEEKTRIIDCGVSAPGGLEVGRRLAEICLADLASVHFVPTDKADGVQLAVTVQTDQPVAACMASQYAGWQIAGTKFFAMGSGPMRAAAHREPLFQHIGHTESAQRAVGVLETAKLPPLEICNTLAQQCGVSASELTLAAARTASIAGSVQVVARSVETALHKLHELGYDLTKVISGYGEAPLPPIAADDMAAIGRTNDVILYGGHVTLWVRDDDERLAEIGPRVPSCASGDFGEPFAAIFKRYNGDFYKIDPLLFSPAQITFVNLTSGRSHVFGQKRPDILKQSLTS